MTTLAQIKSPVWTYSISGGIAEGIAAIRQSIDIIVRTTKGTDPLRPLFGSDVYKYQDYPANVAIPNIKKAIIDALDIWEARITVTGISHFLQEGRLYFSITYRLKDSELIDTITVYPSGSSTGTQPDTLTLQAPIPGNPNNYQFKISCILDDENILPTPPEDGFATPAQLYEWARINWSNYGTWYLTATNLVGHIRPGYTTGSLIISLINKIKFTGLIPGLAIGEKYHAKITVDGASYSNEDEMHTVEQLRAWAQDTFASLGTWQVETAPGSFDDSFNNDFALYVSLLSITTDQAQSITIEVTTIPV